MGKLIRNGIEYGGGNGTDIFEVTQAEYDALRQAGTLVHNALYVITDAPALEYTAEDLSYDGGTETTKQKIDELNDDLVFKRMTISAPIANLASGGSTFLTANNFNWVIPDGFTPVGLYGYTMFGSANGCIIYELGLSSQGTDVVCRIYNSAPSATGANGRVYLGILLVKASRLT